MLNHSKLGRAFVCMILSESNPPPPSPLGRLDQSGTQNDQRKHQLATYKTGQFFEPNLPRGGGANLPYRGASLAIMTRSPWLEITLYCTEKHERYYLDNFRLIVPYLNI